MLIRAPHRGAHRGFSQTTQKAPAMLPDTLPPAGSSTRTNGAPPAPLDAAQLAYIVQMQNYMGQRLAALEQLLTQMSINQTNGQQQVLVKDVSMSFWSMVIFMVKWALASIPAIAIVIGAIMAAAMFSANFFSTLLR